MAIVPDATPIALMAASNVAPAGFHSSERGCDGYVCLREQGRGQPKRLE
jgi:hypothetical protein